jgi:hypothetical protein
MREWAQMCAKRRVRGKVAAGRRVVALPKPIELPPEIGALPSDGSAPQVAAFAESAMLDELERLTASVLHAAHGGGQPSRHAASDERAGAGLVEALLFLRLAEERGLEPRGQLEEIARGPEVGARLAMFVDDAARRYGAAGLASGDRGAHPDRAAMLRAAEGDALVELLRALAGDGEFRTIGRLHPAALGRLYERSLAAKEPRGRNAAPAGREITQKRRVRREKRKSHGVFYTPGHVVDYVLARTLGRADEAAHGHTAPVRVLDPACGSGAFLLGAYDWLLAAERARRGALTLDERARLLASAIFGVDVDGAALQVAKLSLLLTCFEANDPLPSGHPALADLLAALDRHLRRGHSLLDVDWRGRGAVPLDWRRAFPDVFAEGGFDVVIGNPPYLSFGGRHAVEISDELRQYYAEHYESGGWPTAHSLFLERAVKLLSRRFVSFVVPDQVGHLAGYRSAREIAQREAGLIEVRYWGERVFPGVTTPALTIVLDKEKKGARTELVDRNGASHAIDLQPGQPWTASHAHALIDRLRARSFSLDKLVGDCGIRTTSAKDQVVPWPGATENVVPVLEGKLVGRYGCRAPSSAVRLDSSAPLFISRKERYDAVRFVIRQTASYPIVGPREHAVYFRNSLLALFSPAGPIDVHYLVALLNSKLLRFVYTETVREAHQKAFPQVKVKALQSLPLRALDLERAEDKRRHDALVELAMTALAAQSRAIEAKIAGASGGLAEFERIDRAIDDAVYDLYELTEIERATVEQSLGERSA